jgi:hypothetical protein
VSADIGFVQLAEMIAMPGRSRRPIVSPPGNIIVNRLDKQPSG